MNFQTFKGAVAKQFEAMQKHSLFRVDVEKDELYATYLGSFPEGTNPIYRERTEHDCSCCKQFIRNIGDVVAIIDDKLVSIWDIKVTSEPAYQAVADALSALVKSKAIANPFLHYERTVGTDKSFEDTVNGVKTWDHFHVNLKTQFVMPNKDIATVLGEKRALRDVLHRSLVEITTDAVDTVLELIAQNSLYRGQEHQFAVSEFRKLQQKFLKLDHKGREFFAWQSYATVPVSVSKIRNTSIGTLLVDLSEGVEMEDAVKKFEAMVAPANYKRPTALVTKAMVEKAKETIEGLGLTSALERRYANINDITVNNILFADRKARNVMLGNVFDDIASSVGTNSKSLGKVEEVGIEKFIKDILPTIDGMEVLVENKHSTNFVSLITAVDPTAGKLFKWNNPFSWSYNGEFADSIKERVKAAGGNVTGELCCRLAWDYTDDLDFHMSEPDGGHVYFATRGWTSKCGGKLDVDANGGSGMMKEPVENIFYERISSMKEGIYNLYVNNYSRRSDGVGFTVEVDIQGTVHTFVYDKVVKTNQNVAIAKLKYSRKTGLEIIESLPSTTRSKEVWGINTQNFQKVNVMMHSPNYWDDQGVGNKHYFFMLEGCKNEGNARGFYNEFLSAELDKHRKVLEMVGSKMKAESADSQLSGLGFSSTQRNELICRVKGSFTRTLKIVF